MLAAIFSFRGRVNRLQYLFGGTGLGVFVVILFVALLIGKSPKEMAAVVPLMLLLVIPVGIGATWISLSLQARRIRDIGWNPVLVLPLWFVAVIVDKAFLPGFPHLSALQWSQQSLFGSLLNLALGGALMFWPGNGGGRAGIEDIAGVFDDPDPAPQARERPAYAATPAFDRGDFERQPPRSPAPRDPAPAPQPYGAPAFGRAPAAGGFGRRGL
ncbi:MAG: hypothetical protein JWP35_2254 [Caulobacter sp.]|nr:hypothetical protein [Caulobacter sp.]